MKLKITANKAIYLLIMILGIISIVIDFVSDVSFFFFDTTLKDVTSMYSYFIVHMILLVMLLIMAMLFIFKGRHKCKTKKASIIFISFYLIVFGLGKLITSINGVYSKCIDFGTNMHWINLLISSIFIITPVIELILLFKKDLYKEKIYLLPLAIFGTIYLVVYLILGIIEVGSKAFISTAGIYSMALSIYFIFITIMILLNFKETD